MPHNEMIDECAAVKIMADAICEAEWKRACDKAGTTYKRPRTKPSTLRDMDIAVNSLRLAGYRIVERGSDA